MTQRAGILSVLLLGLTLAACGSGEDSVLKVTATVTDWDPTTKSLSLEGKLGTKRTFIWDDETEIRGQPKVGKQVRIRWEQVENRTRVLRIRAIRDRTGKRRGGPEEENDCSPGDRAVHVMLSDSKSMMRKLGSPFHGNVPRRFRDTLGKIGFGRVHEPISESLTRVARPDQREGRGRESRDIHHALIAFAEGP